MVGRWLRAPEEKPKNISSPSEQGASYAKAMAPNRNRAGPNLAHECQRCCGKRSQSPGKATRPICASVGAISTIWPFDGQPQWQGYLFGGATAFISDTVLIASSATVTGHAPASILLNSISIFDPNMTVWTPEDPANSPPPPRYKHSAVALGEKMYIFFGEGDSGLLQDIWMYDPLSKEWQEQVVSSISKPAARSGHTSVVLAGQIFLYGGKNDTGTLPSAACPVRAERRS